MKRITDKSFVYTPSFETDLKKKFRMMAARERKLEREQDHAQSLDTEDSTVVPIAKQALRTRSA